MISFLSVFPPYRGGIAKFSDSLYRELNKQTGAKAYNFEKLYPWLLFPGSSQTLEEAGREYEPRIFHPYNPLSWDRTASQLVDDGTDCLIYSYWHPFFAPAYTRVLHQCRKRKPDITSVCIAHNIVPHEAFPFKRSLTRRMMGATDLAVLLSGQTEEEFLNLGLSTGHTKLFHPIYELDPPEDSPAQLKEKYGVAEEERIVLFMGLVRRYKGVDLLIEALNGMNLEKQRIRPFIVGEFYTDKQELLDEIKEEHRDRYTVIDEFVPEEAMAEILSMADLMVLPYRTASQSGVLANAIHFNLPSLVSDQPGLTEHIEDGKNGLVFRTGDARDLRRNIETYLENDLKTELSGNLARLKEELSWPEFTRRLLESVESLG